jgi:glycosyltransferase involved in cell wall biosynthesis
MSQARSNWKSLRGRSTPPRVALVGRTVAGIETQFRNIATTAKTFPWLEPVIVPVNPYHPDLLERRLRFLPANTRGTLRSVPATAPLFSHRGIDAVWTQVDLALLPWLVTYNWSRQVPVMYSTDCTPRLLLGFGPHYQKSVGRSPTKRFLRDYAYRWFLRRVTWVNTWTKWAARSLEDDYGVPASRIQVLPPGVDVSFWRPADHSEVGESADRKHSARVLFVGADFERKGGDLLLDVYRRRLRGKVEIDLVTRGWRGDREEGITVHSELGPNDGRLRDLYQRADIFVLPTRADCFSMAALEAMASGLPVIICPAGGIAEMMTPGRQGFFIKPDNGRDLAQAILTLVDDRSRREAMRSAARALVLAHYDASINTRRLLETLLTGDPPVPGEIPLATVRAAGRGSR